MLLESLVKATVELQGFRVVTVTGDAGGLVADLACGWRIANQPRNPLRLSSLVILGVVARMSRCATRSSYWFT